MRLRWRQLADRHEAVILQQFTCTEDPPRSPHGRRLPHPRRWEWEAQAHLRQMSVRFRTGELLIAGFNGDSVIAAAHLLPGIQGNVLEVFIAAAGVDLSVRHGGGVFADETMSQIKDLALANARAQGAGIVMITGNIHVRNIPSQNMAARAGFEPVGILTGDYQTWLLRLDL